MLRLLSKTKTKRPALEQADLDHCRALLRRGSKSFSAASRLLPKRVRAPAAALYAFCRIADDAIDGASREGVHQALEQLRARLDRVYAGTPIDDPVDRALCRAVLQSRMPRALLDALIEGFAWDAEGRRYPTILDVYAYGARVAGAVGAMMTVLLGRRDALTLSLACDMGVAMQLTNIARDVGEDARMGRLYLPVQWMLEAGLDPDAFLREPRMSPALADVIARVLREADVLYARAERGIARLPEDCRASIGAAGLIYAQIGRRVEEAGFDSVSRRAVVPLWTKARLLFQAWWKARASRGQPGSGPPGPSPAFVQTAFLVDAAAGA